MKKLNKISLQDEILSKEQLKKVTGGRVICYVSDASGVYNAGPCSMDTVFDCLNECNETYIPLGLYCNCWYDPYL